MLSIDAETVLVPLASEDDARRTCTELSSHVTPGGRIVLVHVIEKAGGAPDKASVEQREERAEAIFTAARDALATPGKDVETRVLYGTDVADTVFAAAEDVDAELVVFSPREASRLTRFLSGDTTLDLVTATDRPLLVLPGEEDGDSEE